MTSIESLPQKSLKSWLVKPLGWMLTTFKFLIRFVPLIWTTAAIYWSNLPWGWARLVLALAFLALGIYALWVKPNRRILLVFAAVFLVVFAWYHSIRPSDNRNWRPDVAVMPRAVIDGDRVLLKNVRNFDYRSADDFAVRYEDRVVLLSQNLAANLILSTAVFAMIYKLMPRVQIDWRDVWIGAVVTALLFIIGKFLIGLYLGRSGISSRFRSAGSLVVVLLWVYYSAQVFLFGAEFTWAYSHKFGSRKGQPAN